MQLLLLFVLAVVQALCDSANSAGRSGSEEGRTPARSMSTLSAATLRDCARIYGSGLRVCSAVHADAIASADTAKTGRPKCNEMLCKSLCCKAASKCQSTSFLSLTIEECISSSLQKQTDGCCVVGKSKGATMVYAGGAVGAMIIISGLYFIVSMGSVKVIKGEKPREDETQEKDQTYETKMPHMEVNQLIATDGDDVFWED
ncbi:type IV secretory pathway 4 component [Babesia ovis]|uniref:Type IV secretory pathway 4 component n=1 Tax=Babesia ovis TaxID=5869 RepID=A0A9W5WTP5_BABOV|nr:type IV secretory pathway 4 component [Babesia ovis]